ncbi:MAG: hypothetical protein HeimC3_54980 [Candidatus Heimdallarchaeota archaeon LC_3]|nr:MAG: hypothetical protein HeimC3_54980 [Candidatus Heimdallarchaeota archaeon LC_3]
MVYLKLQEITEENKKEELFKFWVKLPVFKVIPYPEGWISIDQEVRKKILSILAEGIEEEWPSISGTKRRRRALSAKEIRENLTKNLGHTKENKKEDEEYTLQNVYFHLQKLVEGEYIKEVASLSTGRRPIMYYGRTAKILIPSQQPETKKKDSPFFNNLVQVIKYIHPELTLEEIEETFNQLDKTSNIDQEIVKKWIEEKNNILQKVDVDYKELYLYLFKIRMMNSNTVSLYQKITEMLDFSLQ